MANAVVSKQAKQKVKLSLQNVAKDDMVRDSVINSKKRELDNINKSAPKLAHGQEAMFKELLIADWTDTYADTLAYSFNSVSKLLINKLKSFNFYTRPAEVIKQVYLLLNVCITHGKLHLFDYHMKRMEASKLPLLQNTLIWQMSCLTL
jgi:hypothetical protein